MINEELFTKTKLSELVGWSESGGRRWIKHFKDYIPTVEHHNRIMYNNDSLKRLAVLKELSEAGLTISEIKGLIKDKGFPENKDEIKRIIKAEVERTDKYEYDKKIAKTIPTVKDILIPFLEIIRDVKPYPSNEITDKLSQHFKLNDYQQVMRYETNKDSIFLSRVRSARYSLKKEEYIEEINKLTYQITEEGLELLNNNKKGIASEVEELEKVVDPLNVVKENIEELNNQLSNTLLKNLTKVHWMRFEDIVVELLTVMGYGDGQVTKRTNDEGLDGIIKEDKLGLENIYIQAKRWKVGNSIGREVVQSFSGALDSKGARKGIFITTSHFTEGAKKYADKLEAKKIILIDGKELSKLMIAYNVGVEKKSQFIIKDIDYDYFKEE